MAEWGKNLVASMVLCFLADKAKVIAQHHMGWFVSCKKDGNKNSFQIIWEMEEEIVGGIINNINGGSGCRSYKYSYK